MPNEQVAADLRARLIDRIRSDDSFAEALKSDPLGPIRDSDLGPEFDALSDDSLKAALADPKMKVLTNVEGAGNLADSAWSVGCCITVIY